MVKTDRRIPVISDSSELNIPWRTLQTIIAGRSVIDTYELNINNLDEANKFLQAYGIENSEEAEKLVKTALEYIQNILLKDVCFCLPEKINSFTLQDLILESSAESKSRISQWSCVILKVCHAVAHAQWAKDEEAYNAALVKIKLRLQPFIIESQGGIWIGDDSCRIPVVEYRIKTRKKLFRIVTKLLLKEGNLSVGVYDHIGVRIVTKDIFSAILLIKFLRSRHIFMYANVLPQKSKNSMAEFHQIEELFAEFSTPIPHTLIGESESIDFGSSNPYSSKEFQMIKIVERVLVTTGSGRKVFAPCEFQILAQQTHASLSKKKTNHAAYEKRQIRGVKNRLFDGTSLLEGL